MGLTIGDAAKKSGLPAKTIRYYEDIDLIRATRDGNGYRVFSDKDCHKLTFLARARHLGFSIDDCRLLLTLWEDQARASADVRRLADAHLERIAAKIADLRSLQETLTRLVESCAGDDRPDCPILKDLAGEP